MSIMPEPTTTGDQINDSIVYAAQIALAPFKPTSAQQAADMLLFWIRRAEMTDADVAAVQEAMFPEPVDQPLKLWDCGKPGCPTHFAAGPCPRTQADEESAAGPRTVPNILPTPVTPLCVVHSPNYCSTHQGVHPADLEELRELLSCPDWCVSEHAGDNPADPVDNLILHFAAEHIPGIQVLRCDCPAEGTVGKPALRVRVEVELETWEQAAELAHAVLDGFGYLAGADQR